MVVEGTSRGRVEVTLKQERGETLADPTPSADKAKARNTTDGIQQTGYEETHEVPGDVATSSRRFKREYMLSLHSVRLPRLEQLVMLSSVWMHVRFADTLSLI